MKHLYFDEYDEGYYYFLDKIKNENKRNQIENSSEYELFAQQLWDNHTAAYRDTIITIEIENDTEYFPENNFQYGEQYA